LVRRNRVALYWIYLRNRYSTDLFQTAKTGENAELVPQRIIHQFFLDADIPYRVYMAENPDSLERAIADVGRLQNLPIRYQDVIPRRDLSDYAYRVALILLLIQLLAKVFEGKTWR
jgi:mxaC protein